MLARIIAWDQRLSRALAARRHPLIQRVLLAFTWSGATFVWFTVAGVLLLARHRHLQLIPQQDHFLSAMLAALIVLFVGGLIKRLVKRPRPFAAGLGLEAAVWAPGKAHSFPSTHAATGIALATALFSYGHPWAPFVLGWALITAFSRVFLGVHFPSDVLAGVLLGIGSGLIDWRFLVPR